MPLHERTGDRKPALDLDGELGRVGRSAALTLDHESVLVDDDPVRLSHSASFGARSNLRRSASVWSCIFFRRRASWASVLCAKRRCSRVASFTRPESLIVVDTSGRATPEARVSDARHLGTSRRQVERYRERQAPRIAQDDAISPAFDSPLVSRCRDQRGDRRAGRATSRGARVVESPSGRVVRLACGLGTSRPRSRTRARASSGVRAP